MTTQSELDLKAYHPIDAIDFSAAKDRFSGKVRENFVFANGTMAIVVTDRVSVFDFKIGTVPYKGQVLNQMAAWWFKRLDEINIPHHLISMPHPNVSLVRHVKPLPIEMVVRAYLTGSTTTSSWYAYQHHNRMICGIQMPAGMRKNEAFEKPISTPATKAASGHDENVSKQTIIERGLVSEKILNEAESLAFRMFERGQELARERGLILVDTKYEMGVTDSGELVVIDEVHTPDSSRYWIEESYAARLQAGEEPESLDKEFVRRMIVGRGYDVESDARPSEFFNEEIQHAAARKYASLYERMVGAAPDLRAVNQAEIIAVLEQLAA